MHKRESSAGSWPDGLDRLYRWGSSPGWAGVSPRVARIARPPQPARAGDGLRRGCAGADLRSAVGERDAPIRRELQLGEARFGPGAKAPLDAAEADPIMFSGMRGVVGLLARGAAGPQRMAAGLL